MIHPRHHHILLRKIEVIRRGLIVYIQWIFYVQIPNTYLRSLFLLFPSNCVNSTYECGNMQKWVRDNNSALVATSIGLRKCFPCESSSLPGKTYLKDESRLMLVRTCPFELTTLLASGFAGCRWPERQIAPKIARKRFIAVKNGKHNYANNTFRLLLVPPLASMSQRPCCGRNDVG